MKTDQLQSKNALLNNVVRRLTKSGYQVLSARIGNLRPVIEIERPDNLCNGFVVTTRHGQEREEMNVSSLGGCLITWRA